MRSADSPEDDYLAGRSRDEIREERERASIAFTRRWPMDPDWQQEQDDIGAHQYEMEQTDGPR